MLGSAAFTRGDRDVLPDVHQPRRPSIPLTASIELQVGDELKTIEHCIGRDCPELDSFYVFDSTSVHVHLTGSNALSFAPAGLSTLTRLAETTDRVRERLRERVREFRVPHRFDALFVGDSPVRDLIVAINAATDLAKLERLATLSPAERTRVPEIEMAVAELRLRNKPDRVTALDQEITDLQYLSARLEAAAAFLDDAVVSEILAAVADHRRAERAVRAAGHGQFECDGLRATGTPLWTRFIETARALAELESQTDRSYPQPGDRCLLCQQPLDDDAQVLIHRLWSFLAAEAKGAVEVARRRVVDRREALASLDLGFFDSTTTVYRSLLALDHDAHNRIRLFVLACRQRRETLMTLLAGDEPAISVEPLPPSGLAGLEPLMEQSRTRRRELADADPTAEIATLEVELRQLRHRLTLADHLAVIKEHVMQLRWADRALEVAGHTGHITRKYNQLFDRLVTKRYLDLFDHTLRDLQRPLQVKVRTRGKKGNVHKQIVVAAGRDVGPDKVLSEGEKRAVALADFLTEVALDPCSCGIVLDDPVTSLDLEWRGLVADILGQEATRRQVIVFTTTSPSCTCSRRRPAATRWTWQPTGSNAVTWTTGRGMSF